MKLSFQPHKILIPVTLARVVLYLYINTFSRLQIFNQNLFVLKWFHDWI